ncbi:MAG: hypothetical protein RHS_0456 [Robinsoniella sp. RHS]|nr:MAG: hypothetical protein RHS_0456 [Robinsoniella sp. RHS]
MLRASQLFYRSTRFTKIYHNKVGKYIDYYGISKMIYQRKPIIISF